MVSKSKLYNKLDLLEVELKERLILHLEIAAQGDNDLIFCVKGFNPFPQLSAKTDKITEELVAMGAQVLSLKAKLNEPSEGSIAERICWYCREWGDTERHHRKSALSLARQFLDEITE